jgi:hypothetical protein
MQSPENDPPAQGALGQRSVMPESLGNVRTPCVTIIALRALGHSYRCRRTACLPA